MIVSNMSTFKSVESKIDVCDSNFSLNGDDLLDIYHSHFAIVNYGSIWMEEETIHGSVRFATGDEVGCGVEMMASVVE